MPLDCSIIGAVSQPERFTVERGAIRKFANAIGDPNPAFQNGDIAPPTFPVTFWLKIPELSDVDQARIIHAGEEYRYERPIVAGDVLTCRLRVTDLFEKQGKLGRMLFLVTALEARDPTGQLVVETKRTVIIHGGGE